MSNTASVTVESEVRDAIKRGRKPITVETIKNNIANLNPLEIAYGRFISDLYGPDLTPAQVAVITRSGITRTMFEKSDEYVQAEYEMRIFAEQNAARIAAEKAAAQAEKNAIKLAAMLDKLSPEMRKMLAAALNG